ncbi:hypothetical protein ET475_15625 [Microbacterium protaetiae]|uniref:AbiEi antitoxin C-terminal domain-containing protein n=1 Tax=Microbacterium protaetiae TaxID=2509458 RepID=A0A4P6EJ09_9MICO|nr:hypothetical protein [Microbacterium protaetiae]QAY61269.1 hypothetical protein ET475_15625 [Microbacterium protaetiae]
MPSPYLYFPDERLSVAELAAACLDGHLVALGDAYIPADAVETPALRGGSLRPLLGDTLAATTLTAAWIHGAAPSPPARYRVQRATDYRLHHVIDRRLDYHDTPVPMRDLVRIGGVWVTTAVRTLIDLARAGSEADCAAAQTLLRGGEVTVGESMRWLEQAGPVRGKRQARARLAAWARDQLDVTR